MIEREIKREVEAIFALENAGESAFAVDDFAESVACTKGASDLQDRLEAVGITLEQDKGDIEIYHVLKDGKPYLLFHTAEWAWRTHDGKWEWDWEPPYTRADAEADTANADYWDEVARHS